MGWIVKSVPGVLPSLELEHLVSLLGLAFQLPYVPDDSCRDMDILYVSMYKNAFNFSTVTTPAAGEGIFAYLILCQLLHFVADVKKAAAKASGSKTVTGSKTATGSKSVEKKGLLAPASPAMSKKKAVSTAARKYSLCATEAGKDPLTFINLNIKLTFLSANLRWEEAPAQSIKVAQ